MSVSTCPTEAELEALVSGNLTANQATLTTEHIGACTRCQTTIQHVAERDGFGPGISLEGVAIEQLVGADVETMPPQDSAYWNAVNQLSSEWEAVLRDNDQRRNDAAESSAAEPANTTPSTADATPTLEAPTPVGLPFLKKSEDPAYLGRLHHFEVSRVIGRGGMGIVLEAFDTHLQRVVAIKVLNPEYAKNDVARQRFCREGRAAAAISHEHVVAMHQVAREDEGEVAFLVMQYIEGDTLEQRLQRQKPMPPREAARIAMQIAAGLAAAHQRSMVHRDIKPANILIEAGTERVKLTDFGLARATDDVRLTKTGMDGQDSVGADV